MRIFHLILILIVGLPSSALAIRNCYDAIESLSYAEDAIAIETRLSRNYGKVAPPNIDGFRYIQGRLRVLVIASHATSHVRKGIVKKADTGTGSLAVMLHKVTGASALFTIYQSPLDPNYYNDTAFKEKLKRIIEQTKPTLVVDLHTSAITRPYDVDFGTRHGRSLFDGDWLAQLKADLQAEGIQNFSENFFPAQKNETNTKWVSDLGTPCLQLEINERWLLTGTPGSHGMAFARLLRALAHFVGRF